MTLFPARPESVEVDLQRSAIIVVDMQNAFATQGGMLDISGMDIAPARKVITALQPVLNAARKAGILVIYLQMAYDANLANSGGPESPNWHKELALLLMRRRPEMKGKLLTEGQWDWEVVEPLKPHPEDLVVSKPRYSGFCSTPLDSLLRTRGVRTLFFTGVATNVCVESTLRDAFFLDYWPILLRDATMQAGPPNLQEATIQNVEMFLGWTSCCAEFLQTVEEHMHRGVRVQR